MSSSSVTAGHILIMVRQGRETSRYGCPIVPVTAVLLHKPKKSPARRGSVSCSSHTSARNHTAGLHALGTLGGFEFHRLPLGQRLVTIGLNRRKMHEYVRAAIARGDKSESLGIVEPLDDTSLHSAKTPPHLPGVRANQCGWPPCTDYCPNPREIRRSFSAM